MNSTYQLIERVWEQKLAFISTFFIVFTVTYAVLFVIDFLPETPTEEQTVAEEMILEESVAVAEAVDLEKEAPIQVAEELSARDPEAVAAEVELPLTISIKKLNKTITVLNPMSRTIADLDKALLDGVVRHPDSATLTQEGNVFILGHSSYLPNVFNKNFQAFNGIEDLAWGDTVEVTSENSVFTYRVEKVYRANAQELTVPIAGIGHKLTLATCNSFGSIDDRFIVEATRINARAL